jgi:hypothetical protein
MSSVHRLYPVGQVLPAERLDDEPLPTASPPGRGLALCPHCGVENGITAPVCWSCDAELPPVEAIESEAEGVPVAGNTQGPEQSVPADGEPTPELAGAAADADSRYPILTQVVEDHVQTPAPALAAPGAVPKRGAREVVAAAIVVLAVLAAGAYLYFPMPRNVPGAPLSANTEVDSGGVAGGRDLVAPTKADPTHAGSTPSTRAEATRSAVADALAAAARALAIKPDTANDAGAAAPAVAPANDVVDVAAQSKTAPQASTAASTSASRRKSRGTMPSANAAAAVPPPSRVEPARQPSAPFGPCTATVAALGLCAAPSAQSKE